MPRIQMTRTVKIALWLLQIYLITMLVLIALKFVWSVGKTNSSPQKEPPRASGGLS